MFKNNNIIDTGIEGIYKTGDQVIQDSLEAKNILTSEKDDKPSFSLRTLSLRRRKKKNLNLKDDKYTVYFLYNRENDIRPIDQDKNKTQSIKIFPKNNGESFQTFGVKPVCEKSGDFDSVSNDGEKEISKILTEDEEALFQIITNIRKYPVLESSLNSIRTTALYIHLSSLFKRDTEYYSRGFNLLEAEGKMPIDLDKIIKDIKITEEQKNNLKILAWDTIVSLFTYNLWDKISLNSAGTKKKNGR